MSPAVRLLGKGCQPQSPLIGPSLSVAQALAIMAQPRNVRTSIAELASLSDEIWYLAGDISTDTSWYTRRASLSTIYASTG